MGTAYRKQFCQVTDIDDRETVFGCLNDVSFICRSKALKDRIYCFVSDEEYQLFLSTRTREVRPMPSDSLFCAQTYRGQDLHFLRSRDVSDHVTVRFAVPFPIGGPLEPNLYAVVNVP